jgi:glycerol-3-phosphate dehydrogenase subunit B
MKSDVIIIGAELDSLLAAARLAECGHSVQLLSSGAGGLNQAPAGIHVLGFGPGETQVALADPFAAILNLDMKHPYRKVGKDAVAGALRWFSGLGTEIGFPVALQATNKHALTPAGLTVPALGTLPHLATLEACDAGSVALVDFPGMRDFPLDLILAELTQKGIQAHVLAAPLPGQLSETVALAKSFDRLADPAAYFSALKSRLPTGVSAVLFPAVLGLRNHLSICAAAEKALGVACLEVPTLPTSVPGMRLDLALRQYLQSQAVETIANFKIEAARISPDGITITDANGRDHDARVAIVATGGVLMGGLEVLSCGTVQETVFALKVWQSRPLAAATVDQTLDALHRTGVETNSDLNPVTPDGGSYCNVFVTGQTLAHCNPAAEASADGIAVATAWAAAQAASAFLERKNHE